MGITAAAIGIGVLGVGEEHLFTFLLSSPMTARTLVREKGQVDQVRTDLSIALVLSFAFAFLMAFLLRSFLTLVFGILFGIGLYWIYRTRANL